MPPPRRGAGVSWAHCSTPATPGRSPNALYPSGGAARRRRREQDGVAVRVVHHREARRRADVERRAVTRIAEAGELGVLRVEGFCRLEQELEQNSVAAFRWLACRRVPARLRP